MDKHFRKSLTKSSLPTINYVVNIKKKIFICLYSLKNSNTCTCIFLIHCFMYTGRSIFSFLGVQVRKDKYFLDNSIHVLAHQINWWQSKPIKQQFHLFLQHSGWLDSHLLFCYRGENLVVLHSPPMSGSNQTPSHSHCFHLTCLESEEIKVITYIYIYCLSVKMNGVYEYININRRCL